MKFKNFFLTVYLSLALTGSIYSQDWVYDSDQDLLSTNSSLISIGNPGFAGIDVPSLFLCGPYPNINLYPNSNSYPWTELNFYNTPTGKSYSFHTEEGTFQLYQFVGNPQSWNNLETILFVSQAGNLGIRNVNPQKALDVNGDINFTGNLYKNGQLFSGGAGSSPWGTNGSSLYYNSGNVGIGTTTPYYKLTVNGDIYSNGGWLRTSGNAGVYFESYGGGLYMTDGSWIRTYGSKNFYHNAGIMRTDGSFQVGPDGDRFLVSQDGKVGVGMQPGEKLDIAGNLRTSGLIYSTKEGYAQTYLQSWGLSGDGTIYIEPAGDLYLTDKWARAGMLRIEFGKTVFATGNVGIGATDPQANLHIKGPSSTWIAIDKPTNETEGGIQFRNAGTTEFYLYTDNADNNALKIQSNSLQGEGDGTPRLMIPKDNKNIYLGLSGGNILIGKTIQEASTGTRYRLDVNGPMRANEVVVNTTGADFVFHPSYKLAQDFY